jgi:hypothetical protein
MKMPKRNNKKRAPINTARPKITPKMKKTIKKFKNKKNRMTPMKKGY